MNTKHRVFVTSREKFKRKIKVGKSHSPANIAQRYMEVRRLREKISEAESRAYAR